MSFKKVSSLVILNKIASQFKFSDTGWQGLAIEYIGEAIRGIGHHTGFKKESKYKIQVRNYRAQIPCEFESIETIWYCGCPLLLAYDRDKIHMPREGKSFKKSPASYVEIQEYNKIVDRINYLVKQIEEEPVDIMNPDLTSINALKDALNESYWQLQQIGTELGDNYKSFNGNWYYIENDFIKTSFPSGDIYIDGNTFHLDDNGYPMVVDTYKYQKALEWYVIFQLLLGEYDHNKLDWREAENRWEDFRQRAANEPKIMGIDKLERFTRRWNSIKRSIELTYQV